MTHRIDDKGCCITCLAVFTLKAAIWSALWYGVLSEGRWLR